jgi:uncharacterized protein (DUF4415 family)
MKERRIIARSKNEPRKGKTDWEALDQLSDEEISAAVADDPDAAPLDVDWSDAELNIPPSKKAISIRLDEDVVEFFRQTGSGYQTRINAVLRHFMEHSRRKTG